MRFAKQANRRSSRRLPDKRSHIVSLLYSVFGKKSRGFPIFSPRAGFSRDFTAERAPRFRPRPRPERQKALMENAVCLRKNIGAFLLLRADVPAQDEICLVEIRTVSRSHHNHLFLCTLYHVTSLAFGGVFAKVRSFQTVRMFFICEQKSANKKNLYIFCKYSRIRQNCA